MEFPLDFTFRNMEPSARLQEEAQESASKLSKVYSRIQSCRLVVEALDQRHLKGREFRVQLHVQVPGDTVHVQKDGLDDLHSLTREAFHSAGRQLTGLNERRREKHRTQE